MMEEVWKPIPEFEGYEVSNQGRVRSYYLFGPGSRVANKPQRILKPTLSKDGYLVVGLRGKITPIHKVVALAFIGPYPDGMEVCHNNGQHTDNRLANLRYDTHYNNMVDFTRHNKRWVSQYPYTGQKVYR